MATIVNFNTKSQVNALTMFRALTSGTIDTELCPRGSLSTLPALSPCNGCPLFEVCSDECGMNDANGYYPVQGKDASFDDNYKLLDW